MGNNNPDHGWKFRQFSPNLEAQTRHYRAELWLCRLPWRIDRAEKYCLPQPPSQPAQKLVVRNPYGAQPQNSTQHYSV